MKTEQKQNMAMNLLILLLITLFIISISMMWLKHDQYHMDGSSMSWIMSENNSIYPHNEDSNIQSMSVETNMTH